MSLRVIAFNANVIWRRRNELSSQVQNLHIMWLCSQRHIANCMRGSSFQIITFIGLTASREEPCRLTCMLHRDQSAG
jgi:hypothetical protein